MTSLIDLRKPIIQFLGVDADPFLEEKKRCQDLLAALKYNFDPPPSSDTICENNRSVRELVKRLHAADYDEDDTDAPCSTRTNSSSSEPEMASQVCKIVLYRDTGSVDPGSGPILGSVSGSEIHILGIFYAKDTFSLW